MPMRSHATTIPTAAGIAVIVGALFGCVQDRTVPAGSAGNLFSTGLRQISELYITRVSSRRLALAGADRLSAPDGKLRITESPGPQNETEIIMAYDGRELAAYPDPSGEYPDAWGRLLSRLIADARAASPTLGALSNENIETAVFDGMTGILDRFSRYAAPEAARDQRAARDGFGGVGVIVDLSQGQFRITQVTAGSAADLAGLKPGDRIVAIDGKPTGHLSEHDVLRELRGPISSTVSVTIVSSGLAHEREFRLRRALTVAPTVTMTLDNRVAVFRVASFNQNTTQQIVEDLDKAKRQTAGPLHGIVLDLRGDPGGLLDQAVSLADVFIARGPIIATVGRHPASRQMFVASGDSVAPQLPIVVLIDSGSASASEIVAAALQDAGRAVIVGSASYGKGTVQTVMRLPNDGELILTWAQLVAPSGYLLNLHGVVPTLCTSDLGNDPLSLETAVQRASPGSSISPLALRPRASLSERDWLELRHSCPEGLGNHPIDIEVAERLLTNPNLYDQAVRGIAAAPKLAAGSPDAAQLSAKPP